jgi:hypothetical protein
VRVVIVPGTLALLPEYASIDDPIPDLRAAVQDAAAWLLEDGPASLLAATQAAERIGRHLLGTDVATPVVASRDVGSRDVASLSVEPVETPGVLVVAGGSARRTEKAPGHFDDRAAGFDAAIGKALAAGEPDRLADIDLGLAEELWAMPDAEVLRNLAEQVAAPVEVQVDYDDAPYGVQYWVVRWQCS